MVRRFWAMGVATLLVACGAAGPLPERSTSVEQALAASPDMLELEPVANRQALFREVTRSTNLFPVIQNGQLRPASSLAPDLLQVPDAGEPASLSFADTSSERWPEERRSSLQGLSEREAAELVARTILASWGIHSASAVRVDRAVGAPYAVAYADGVLRVNPSFLYLASSASMSTATPPGL
jgi:hypothetical protein